MSTISKEALVRFLRNNPQEALVAFEECKILRAPEREDGSVVFRGLDRAVVGRSVQGKGRNSLTYWSVGPEGESWANGTHRDPVLAEAELRSALTALGWVFCAPVGGAR